MTMYNKKWDCIHHLIFKWFLYNHHLSINASNEVCMFKWLKKLFQMIKNELFSERKAEDNTLAKLVIIRLLLQLNIVNFWVFLTGKNFQIHVTSDISDNSLKYPCSEGNSQGHEPCFPCLPYLHCLWHHRERGSGTVWLLTVAQERELIIVRGHSKNQLFLLRPIVWES